MARIGSFEIVDHGVDGEQYFPGCGVSLTEYEECSTGIGDTPAEAMDDCLEQIAMGADVELDDMDARILADLGLDALPTDSVCETCPEFEKRETGSPSSWRGCDGCELHYYVSIRYNVQE